jgi:hypothetical protein
LGLSKQYGKKDWGKSVLEENIRTVAFTTGGSLQLLCVRDFIQSSERQASGTILRLPARKLYWRRLHFSSACLVRMYCINIEDHKRMWVIPCPLQCTILRCVSQYFCSYICTAKNTEWDLHQNEKCHHTKILKKSATLKKEDLISTKIGACKVNLISRIEFVSSVSYQFQPNTHL